MLMKFTFCFLCFACISYSSFLGGMIYQQRKTDEVKIQWSGKRLSIIDGNKLAYYPLEWGEANSGEIVTRPWVSEERNSPTKGFMQRLD
jgi:hypothetical protein